MNTVDFENGVEELTDPAALEGALAGLGLLEGNRRLGPADLEQALRVREALRALLLGNNGVAVERATLETLEEATRRGRLAVRFGDDGRTALLPDAGGLDGALGRIVGVVHTAMADGTWPRLKACPRHICRWVFYDRSKNRSGTWCDPADCGTRERSRRAYRRRRESA